MGEVNDINRCPGRLYDSIEAGNIDLNDLVPRIHELRDCQERLRTSKVEINKFLSDRRVELASPEIVAHYVNDLNNVLSESTLPKKRAFIRSFIKEVKVTHCYSG